MIYLQIYFVLCFSPAGWDNEKKISILFENLHNMKPDDSYEDKIVKPKIGGKVCNSINSQTKNRRKGM